jgi:hypothetical protein
LTLRWTLDHHLVKPYLNCINRSYYSEEVIVGLHAVHGMESIVRCVIEGKETGGLLKECHALLVMVGMCLSKGIEENNAVTKRDVCRTVLFIKLCRDTEGKIIYQKRRKILIDCSLFY